MKNRWGSAVLVLGLLAPTVEASVERLAEFACESSPDPERLKDHRYDKPVIHAVVFALGREINEAAGKESHKPHAVYAVVKLGDTQKKVVLLRDPDVNAPGFYFGPEAETFDAEDFRLLFRSMDFVMGHELDASSARSCVVKAKRDGAWIDPAEK